MRDPYHERYDTARGEPEPGDVVYVVCTTMRSGSGLLCHGLRGTGLAGVPAEYFHPRQRARLAERWRCSDTTAGYIRELRARRSGPNGVFGLKLHSHQMRNLDALDSLLPGAGYVRLRRRDIDAQAVSLWTALQTRQFYSETETGLWTRYEALVNLVFASSPASLLCAYDTRTIAPEVARQARLTHPHTIGPQGVESSSDYGDPGGYVLGA